MMGNLFFFANENGEVSTADLIRIEKHLNGIEPLSLYGEVNADVDESGSITTTDKENAASQSAAKLATNLVCQNMGLDWSNRRVGPI